MKRQDGLKHLAHAKPCTCAVRKSSGEDAKMARGAGAPGRPMGLFTGYERGYHECVTNITYAAASLTTVRRERTFWDVLIGHVTKIGGGPGCYVVSIFGAIFVITPLQRRGGVQLSAIFRESHRFWPYLQAEFFPTQGTQC